MGRPEGGGAWAVSDAELAHRRDGLRVGPCVSPADGTWADWEAVEKLWQRAFSWLHVRPGARKKGGVASGAAGGGDGGDGGEDEETGQHAGGHAVMCGEGLGASAAQRMQMMELLFEAFDAPALYLAKTPALAAFAAGRSSSLVVDCGGGGTSVVPVLDGYVLHKPAARSPRGGEWLTLQASAVVRCSCLVSRRRVANLSWFAHLLFCAWRLLPCLCRRGVPASVCLCR